MDKMLEEKAFYDGKSKVQAVERNCESFAS